jgi:hypothetical protein
MSQLQINKIEFLPINDNPEVSLGPTGSSHDSLLDRLPADLHEVIGAKGHRYRDDFTKAAIYCAKKLMVTLQEPYDLERTGVICATGYGNFKSGSTIDTQASASPGPISGQLFPNSTYSSAAVTVSLVLGARGLNMTLTSGDISTLAGLALAQEYLECGLLSQCILIAGDDFAPFTARNAEELAGRRLTIRSSLGGLLLSKNECISASLSLISAYTSMTLETVLKYLDRNLGKNWHQDYLVHLAGPRPTQLNRECRHLVNLPSDGCYLGAALTLWQIQDVSKRIFTINKNVEGAIIITSSAQMGIGVCILKTNLGNEVHR